MSDISDYITKQTRDFTGHEWVFQAVEKWLADLTGVRPLLLTSGRGSGKTVVAARLGLSFRVFCLPRTCGH